MPKINNIRYKVFLFNRVKKKIRFFDTDTYPLQIRLTAGTRTIYMKSYFFSILQQPAYQQDPACNQQKITVEHVIAFERALMDYILLNEPATSRPEHVRNRYNFLCRDLLHELDISFKTFLIDFFKRNNLPAYVFFLENNGHGYTSELVLNNLEQSLHSVMYTQLLQAAVENGPPYIPLIKFFREKVNTRLPVLPVYFWQQEPVFRSFLHYTKTNYPEYSQPQDYINTLVETHRHTAVPIHTA